MKAAYLEQTGGPEVFKYGDLPDPKAGPGDVVVDIVAASVNGADWKVRRGEYAALKFPYVLGRDFSGTVAALGEGVTDFKVGDAVFGVLPPGQEGTYAEKIAIKAAVIAKKPDGLSHVDATALALIGLTAQNAVEDTLKLKRGETILMQGGAGGVASYAIQLAKHIGARVITTTSTANVDYVRSLGADQVIDYTKEDFTKIGQVCDAVFETVGGDVATQIVRGAQAGRPRRLHRLGPEGAAHRTDRRAGLATAGAAHPRRDGAHRGTVCRRRDQGARDQAL